MPPTSPIPLFLNPRSGSAAAVREALAAVSDFAVHEVEAPDLPAAMKRAVDAGARRVVVSGGDGSIATALRAVAGTPVELGIIPGGTLNHFARHLGIPTDLAEAVRVAAGAHTARADYATVNGVPFHGTSSVGAYIGFVRQRESLEQRHLGYRLASLLAGLRLMRNLRAFHVELEVEGKLRRYRTPLVFIGVGEREMRFPVLGSRVADGHRRLHLIVLRGSTLGSLASVAFAAMARGLRTAARSPRMDMYFVDRFTAVLRRRGPVSIDGEIVTLDTPLEYAYHRDALTVVVPAAVAEPAAVAGGAAQDG